MCNDATCRRHAGEAEFQSYRQTLGPDGLIFGPEEQASGLRYGVAVNGAACQWEIVAVEASRVRHVAFVSPQYRLAQVLDLAGGWARSMAAISH